MRALTRVMKMLVRAGEGWWNNNAFRLAGSLAFYTLFSISPLLIVTVYVIDQVATPVDVLPGESPPSKVIFEQLELLIGEQSTAGLRMVSSSFQSRGRTTFAIVFGLGVVLIGSTAVFAELQDALNLIFHVHPSPGRNAVLLDRAQPAARVRGGDRRGVPADGLADRQRGRRRRQPPGRRRGGRADRL